MSANYFSEMKPDHKPLRSLLGIVRTLPQVSLCGGLDTQKGRYL